MINDELTVKDRLCKKTAVTECKALYKLLRGTTEEDYKNVGLYSYL
jgi:hypothetical protein